MGFFSAAHFGSNYYASEYWRAKKQEAVVTPPVGEVQRPLPSSPGGGGSGEAIFVYEREGKVRSISLQASALARLQVGLDALPAEPEEAPAFVFGAPSPIKKKEEERQSALPVEVPHELFADLFPERLGSVVASCSVSLVTDAPTVHQIAFSALASGQSEVLTTAVPHSLVDFQAMWKVEGDFCVGAEKKELFKFEQRSTGCFSVLSEWSIDEEDD